MAALRRAGAYRHGLLFVYSASMYTALSYGSQYYFLFKQLLGGAAGFAAMAFFAL